MDLLDMLRQRVETASRDVARDQEEFNRIAAKLTASKARLQAFTSAYNMEAKATERPAQNPAPGAVGQASSEAVKSNGNHVNATDVIYQMILGRSADGISPAEIWKATQDRKIDIARNYVYSILARLKEREKIVARDDRYFPMVRE